MKIFGGFKRPSRLLRSAVVFVLTATLAFSPAPVVQALSDSLLDFFHLNGIYYYNPEGANYDCTSTTNGSNVTIIGDSITANSLSQLKSALPQATIWAHHSKRFGSSSDSPVDPATDATVTSGGGATGFAIAKWLVDNGQLGNIVVYALGTNNVPLSQSAVEDLVTFLGAGRQIYFLTNYNSETPSNYDKNNQYFAEAAQYQNVTLIDWAARVAPEKNTYIDPGDSLHVHPTDAGKQLWAEMISQAVGGSGSATGVTNGNYRNYAGDEILGPATLERIETLIPLYQRAIQESGAATSGVTWQILASIHYKEHDLAYEYNPSNNNQGVWQLYTYVVTQGKGSFTPGAALTTDDFVEQTKIMITEVLLPKARGLDLNTDEGVKELFFSYNGKASEYYEKATAMGFSDAQAKIGEGSPYVMNRFDAQRDPNSPSMNPAWKGLYCADNTWCPEATTQRFGAWVIYSALGGATLCSNGVLSGGLTTDQIKALVQDYIHNVNPSDWRNVYWATIGGECTAAPKGNCVTFSQYFIARFTTASDLGATGDGMSVASTLAGQTIGGVPPYGSYNNRDGIFTADTIPHVYSVFSTGRSGHGHTGIVLGIDEPAGKIYIGQEGCGASLNWGLTSIENSLSTFMNDYRYAIIDPNAIKFDELNAAIQAGMAYL